MTNAITVANLNKNFGGIHATRDLSLSIPDGSVFGIIGPNGAGKSTLVDLVTGFTRPTSGTVELDGQRISGLKPAAIAKLGMARTFQHTSLFLGVSVAENLRLAALALAPAGQIEDRIAWALDEVGLTAQAEALADSLPYGAQRRLAIGIAIMSDPRVVLLDEPAAGMNPVESAEFVELIGRLRAGRTILLVEHDMTVIRALCDRSAVLANGALLVEGATDEVLRNENVIDVYLGAPA